MSDLSASPSDSVLNVPWVAGSSKLGRGYAALERQVVQSALEDFTVTEDQTEPDIKYEHIIISSEDELRREIGNTLDVCASVFGIGLQTAFAQLQSLSCTSKSMTTILRCTITSPLSTYRATPKLTASAEELLKSDPARFQQVHGSHFVAGYIRRSTISAVFVFTASNTEVLNTFKGRAKAGKGFVSVDMASRYQELAEKEDVQCTISWETTGIAPAGLVPNPSPRDVEAIFKDLSKHRPKPQIALLEHYCLIDSRVLRLADQHPTSSGIKEGVLEALRLYNKARDCCMKAAVAVGDSALTVGRQFSTLRPSVGNYEEELAKYRERLGQVEKELTCWKERESVLLGAERNARSNFAKEYYHPGHTRHFDFGLTDPKLSQIAHEIKVSKDTDGQCRIHGNGMTQAQTIHIAPWNALIIGFRILSRWNDSTNGPFKIIGGGVGLDHVDVRFQTQHARGGDWGVQVWYADSGLYQRR